MNLQNNIFSFLTLWLCLASDNGLLALEESPLGDGEERAHKERAPVGTVGLVLGRVFLESQDNQVERLRIGDLLSESDTIRTESNGHAHIRFVDNALVSVRPNSELKIIDYKYSSERPEESVVKFSLLEGTARAVSGKAADSAKDKFRLNTPIAAIGVRGTDFVVSVSSTAVRATVNQGAIVLAPFSEQCTALGVGPCSTNSVELDSTGAQILEFNTTLTTPRIIQLSAAGQTQNQLGSFSSRRQPVSPDSLAEAGTQNTDEVPSVVEELTPDPSEAVNNSIATVTDVVSEGVTSVGLRANAKEQAPYQTGFTPASMIGDDVAKRRQLVWGRYTGGKGELERITLPFAEAGEGRSITIGGNFEYFLFREDKEEARIGAGLGRVGFSLDSAQAYYKTQSDTSAVAVTGGDLIVDFQQNKFSTELNMHHLDLGKAVFRNSGRLRDGGYFSSYASDGGSSLAGAVSLDGQEGGYFFDFLNWQGAIQGITLWGAGK